MDFYNDFKNGVTESELKKRFDQAIADAKKKIAAEKEKEAAAAEKEKKIAELRKNAAITLSSYLEVVTNSHVDLKKVYQFLSSIKTLDDFNRISSNKKNPNSNKNPIFNNLFEQCFNEFDKLF